MDYRQLAGWVGLGSLLISLTACGSAPSNSPANSGMAASPSPTPSSSVTPSAPASPEQVSLEPKNMCFEAKTATLTANVQLELTGTGMVYGNAQATIHDQPASYFSSYKQIFAGERQGNNLKLNLLTMIEYDTQNVQETWVIEGDRLTTPGQTYQSIPCSDTAEPPIPVQILRLEFAPGANSTVVEQAVVRGARVIYLVKAKADQRLSLKITSVENNAVVDILAPGGQVLKQEVTQADLSLPAAGENQIIVGGTRGNASYRLEVKIE